GLVDVFVVGRRTAGPLCDYSFMPASSTLLLRLNANEIQRADWLVQVDFALVVELDIGASKTDNLLARRRRVHLLQNQNRIVSGGVQAHDFARTI
uniref:hypothetical protein n=1 Tax=Bradyrhizobium sp. TaxID=376 RepID=UPI00260755CD